MHNLSFTSFSKDYKISACLFPIHLLSIWCNKGSITLGKQPWEVSPLQGRSWHAAHSHEGELNRPWALAIYGVRWLSHICIQAIFYLAHAQISSWLLYFPSLWNPLEEGCSHHDKSHPLWLPLVLIPWVGLWETKVWLGDREHIKLNRCTPCGAKSFQTLNL